MPEQLARIQSFKDDLFFARKKFGDARFIDMVADMEKCDTQVDRLRPIIEKFTKAVTHYQCLLLSYVLNQNHELLTSEWLSSAGVSLNVATEQNIVIEILSQLERFAANVVPSLQSSISSEILEKLLQQAPPAALAAMERIHQNVLQATVKTEASVDKKIESSGGTQPP